MSTVDYNHYSWLRTMEDLFNVSHGSQKAQISGGAGSVSGGLDGSGHLGFAAQPDLRTFGSDVFTNLPGRWGGGGHGGHGGHGHGGHGGHGHGH